MSFNPKNNFLGPDESFLPMLIDTRAAAKLLGLRESRVRMAVFRNEIPYRKIGSLVRFVPEELRAWINSEQLRPKSQVVTRAQYRKFPIQA